MGSDTGGGSPAPVRVVDWIMQALARRGVERVFTVTGGGAMHLDDAAGANEDLDVVCMLHEQAVAIATEAYTKASGKLALALVTAGPGGTNAVTGVAGAWLDSTPMLVISGQVKRSDLVGSTGVRQRGVQELDLGAIVRPITKYTALVLEPRRIRYHLERALHLATSGRPGPVWLEIPLDVQAAPVVAEELEPFDPGELEDELALDPCGLDRVAGVVLDALAESERPVLLVGAGVRLARAEHDLLALVERLGVPVLTTWPAMGVVGDDHPLHVGRPGPLAGRGANFVLQSSDFLLAVGARLDLVTTGYDPADFARSARKFVVDVDAYELAKLRGAIDAGIRADAGDFVRALRREAEVRVVRSRPGWTARCRELASAHPIVLDLHRRPGERVSTYHFADVLSGLLEDDDVLAPCSSGLAIEIFLLAVRLRTGQRAIFTTALGAMGYGPPTAIGACIASGRRRTVCVDGDGGFQLNAQELETIRRLALPVKLFVLENGGYASIRASQQRWFGRVVGADESSGLTLPRLDRLAHAYGLPFVRVDGRSPLAPQLRAVLDSDGPVLCEVPTPFDERREPAQVSEALPDGGMRSRPIEDLAPLLSREELAASLSVALPPCSLGEGAAERELHEVLR